MSFGAEVVARVLGLPEIPSRAVNRAIGVFIAAIAIAMPVTFGHGLELYAKRESQQLTHMFFDPLLRRLQQQLPAPTPSVQPTHDAVRHRAQP